MLTQSTTAPTSMRPTTPPAQSPRLATAPLFLLPRTTAKSRRSACVGRKSALESVSSLSKDSSKAMQPTTPPALSSARTLPRFSQRATAPSSWS